MKSIKGLVLELLKNRNTILFCGSGISYNSGIPTVAPFINYLLDSLEVEEPYKNEFKKTNLPFEVTMEILSEFVDVKPLLDVFDVENPNLNHQLIAKLFCDNYINIIITTNFDRNIEAALNHLGVYENYHFELLASPEKIASFKYDSSKRYIIKLHGSIENKNSLLTFIERIATNNNQETVLNFLKLLFKTNKENILFCGYSFSDDFDINPSFKNITDYSKTVYSIEHQSVILSEKIEQINNNVIGGNGFLLKCNFDKLVTELLPSFNLKSCSLPIEPDFRVKINNWKKNILNDDNKNDKGLNDKLVLIINLFFKTRNYNAINYYLEKAFSDNFSQKHIMFRMEILSKAGLNFASIARDNNNDKKLHEIAIEYFNEALLLAQSINDKFNYAAYSANIAYSYIKIGKYSEAEILLKNAISYFETRINNPIESQPELSKKQYVGYMFTLAGCYRTAKNFKDALLIFEKSLHYANKFGHLETKTSILHGKGLLFIDVKDFKKALINFRESYLLKKKLKLFDDIFFECFGGICFIENTIHGFTNAKIFYENEISLIKSLTPDAPSLNQLIADFM